MQSTRCIGTEGERCVALLLKKQGYTIVATNVHWLGGEIDIIAQRNKVMTFVEVKTRRQESRFPLSGVITRTKQRKIIKTALRFMMQHRLQDKVIRFDVALVTWLQGTDPNIDYIADAFTAPTE